MNLAPQSQSRTTRFKLRATSRQLQLIEVAAARQGQSVTDFILESACKKAEQTLSDQTRLVLNGEQWKSLMDALDAPPRVIPQITKLFSAPPVSKSR